MTQPAEHCGHQPPHLVAQQATECVLRPGHAGSHANETGMRWWMNLPIGRRTASQITDTELDQLYARIEQAELKAEAMTAAMESTAADALAHGLCHMKLMAQCTRAERAEAERDQARGAIRSALPDLQRAIDCLDATCRYHGDCLDPDEYGRRYRAEACCDTGVEPRRAREARQTLDRLRAALDEHQEQP